MILTKIEIEKALKKDLNNWKFSNSTIIRFIPRNDNKELGGIVKKIWDYATKAGEEDPKLATENATMGATASGNVASVANPIAANAKIKRDKNGVPVAPQKKNKDGTAINALDMKNNIMGGKAIKRTQ